MKKIIFTFLFFFASLALAKVDPGDDLNMEKHKGKKSSAAYNFGPEFALDSVIPFTVGAASSEDGEKAQAVKTSSLSDTETPYSKNSKAGSKTDGSQGSSKENSR